MISEDYDKLTPEEKQIKVAELRGFERIAKKGYTTIFWADTSGVDVDGRRKAIPDYLNDLNACHEFENANVMRVSHWLAYPVILADICQAESTALWNATAGQRCKAFVLTMEAE